MRSKIKRLAYFWVFDAVSVKEVIYTYQSQTLWAIFIVLVKIFCTYVREMTEQGIVADLGFYMHYVLNSMSIVYFIWTGYWNWLMLWQPFINFHFQRMERWCIGSHCGHSNNDSFISDLSKYYAHGESFFTSSLSQSPEYAVFCRKHRRRMSKQQISPSYKMFPNSRLFVNERELWVVPMPF